MDFTKEIPMCPIPSPSSPILPSFSEPRLRFLVVPTHVPVWPNRQRFGILLLNFFLCSKQYPFSISKHPRLWRQPGVCFVFWERSPSLFIGTYFTLRNATAPAAARETTPATTATITTSEEPVLGMTLSGVSVSTTSSGSSTSAPATSMSSSRSETM